MTSYYYALWIPQHKEGKPIVRKPQLEEIELRDIPDAPSLKICGDINPNTLLISLRYKIDDVECRPLVFHEYEWSETGFIVYKLNLDDDEINFFCNGFRSSMSKAVYHYVKGFFHEHQFHETDDDSLLDSYFSETSISLSDEDTIKKILYMSL